MPPIKKIRPMSKKEVAEINRYLKENRENSFIAQSNLKVASPILLVKKPDNS
jgi:hypothetical protein